MSAMPFDLSQLHFLRPWWLAALLLLPLLAWWWRTSTQRRNAWRDAVDPHLLPHLLEAGATEPRRSGTAWLAGGMLALAILAMAGPSVRKSEQPLWQTREPLVIALDLSSAALARDLPPSRLAQARAKLATLLREREGGQVALVAFADDAFTVAPLTEDAANVALFLDALAPDVMPEDGHRVDRAIAWSQRLMSQAGFAHGDILLLTDGVDAAGIAESAKARQAGYRVSALGVGSERGGVFDIEGRGLGQARLDADALRRLAERGGGRYASLTPGQEDLRALGVLKPREGAGTAKRGETVASWRDDGYWLLPLVLLLCLPLFRRGTLAAVLACCLLLPALPAQAQATNTWWQRSDQAAHARMQEGVADYRKGDYAKAIDAFTGINSADGQYNLGNALAKAGRYDEAIAAYDRALRSKPGMEDAIANRAAVEAARKRKPPPGNQQRQQNQNSDNNNSGQPRQGESSGKDDPQPPQESQQPPSPPQQEPPPQSPAQPRNQDEQAKADAAQRERMQEALRKQQGKQAAEGKARQPQKETSEQRERRMANQAQLQRVPDDPGALLRARFRLEHERRQGNLP